MSGWETLGSVLGGGQRMSQNAYQNGVLSGARSADLLEQAAARRNQNVGMAQLTSDLVQRAQSGDQQAQAQLESTAAQAGIDPRQFTGAAQQQQSTTFGNTAMGLAMAPNVDLNRLNAVNMVRSGKPVSLSAVQGNTLIDPMSTPGAQAAQGGNVPTDIGQSMIATQGAEQGADAARASASYASAARSRAGIGADKASNYTMMDDGTGHLVRINKLDPTDTQAVLAPDGSPMAAALNGKGVGTGTATAPTEAAPSLMKATFGEPTVGSKPDPNVVNFLAWKADRAVTDPRYNNGNFAVQQWALQGQPPIGADQLNNPDGTPVSLAQFAAAKNGKPAIVDNPTADQPPAHTMGAVISGETPVPAPAVVPASSGPAIPKSQSDFDALPSGAQFINPANGQLMVKK